MRFNTFAASLLAASVRAQSTPPAPPPPPGPLTVQTTSGTYTGLIDPFLPDVHQWLGIPFAQPPLGTLRFMPPQPAPDHGHADAKAYKPICLQDSGEKTGLYWELVPEFQNHDVQSEDCLYLNIWGPKGLPAGKGKGKGKGKNGEEEEEEGLLPVIIWVCGGGFKEGGGHAPYQVPGKWIQRTGTHLVVTFNSRLNVFGFPATAGAERNAGLLDIRMVVEWLRDNVAGFGGDPERMVLYGQSAGANAVNAYAYANPADPIVKGLIISSSSTPATNPTSSPLFHDLAQNAGCAGLNATAELACMQQLDALVLQQKVDEANPDPFRGLFRPIADNVTMFANVTARLEQGLVANIPMIAGFNFNESTAFLVPFDINATTPPPTIVPGTAGLACGPVREAAKRNTYGLTTYRYLYSGNFTNITPRYWLAGMHSSEIPLVFGTHADFRGNSTEFEYQTSYAMQSFWVSFASNPSQPPVNHLGQVWPAFAATNGQTMVFGNSTGLGPSYVDSVAVANKYSGVC